jgi:hypothetical protein
MWFSAQTPRASRLDGCFLIKTRGQQIDSLKIAIYILEVESENQMQLDGPDYQLAIEPYNFTYKNVDFFYVPSPNLDGPGRVEFHQKNNQLVVVSLNCQPYIWHMRLLVGGNIVVDKCCNTDEIEDDKNRHLAEIGLKAWIAEAKRRAAEAAGQRNTIITRLGGLS